MRYTFPLVVALAFAMLAVFIVGMVIGPKPSYVQGTRPFTHVVCDDDETLLNCRDVKYTAAESTGVVLSIVGGLGTIAAGTPAVLMAWSRRRR